MSESYAREVLRRNVAQICQTIGWNGINSTPLDIMVHLLEKYIQTLGTQANRYSEQFNRTEPNLHDLGLVFQDLHVHLPELAEYTRSVPPVPPPFHVENFPKPKESNLNFLKPGSHEVVTRPMHVHEHLPPMYPEKEQDTPVVAGTVEIRQNGIDNTDGGSTLCTSPVISITDSPEKPKELFKRPIDPVSMPNVKKPRLRLEEEERTREISSVMMTMSGFLSPAREGKLPEARPPTTISEKHFEKHKAISHHSSTVKVPVLDKSEKKSKKSKLLNGKIMKSKRKDKSHKGDTTKYKDNSKLAKHPLGYPSGQTPGHPPGYSMKNKDGQPAQNNLTAMAPKALPGSSKPAMLNPTPLVPESVQPTIKQEPVEPSPLVSKSLLPGEEAIPVPRKIPISKSPLISTPGSGLKSLTSSNLLISEADIKKEIIEEEKLASQPDRSKINIFKRISNKSKEEKAATEVVHEKSQADTMISKSNTSANNNTNDSNTEVVRKKTEDSVVNNNDTSAVDLSKEMDLRAHEVISIDDDSLDINHVLQTKPLHTEPHSSVPVNKSLHLPLSKELASVSPKIKKEKKHKDKKDKAAKLEAKLLKKQQHQLHYEMALSEKHNLKTAKPPKSSRPKNESKMLQMPPGFPFFPPMPGRNMMPGPGLIPNSSLIPSNDFLNLANNPALRGIPPSNLLTNPYALGAGGPGLIPGPGFLSGGINPGIPNPLMHMSNFPHTSRSSSVKIPPMLRRPSLEVIPVDNENERGLQKSQMIAREKDRQDKHKSPTIPNILQKHRSKYHKDKSNILKMPPIHPDITIQLNPPKVEPIKTEPIKDTPTPCTLSPEPKPTEPQKDKVPEPTKPTTPEISQDRPLENVEKKKDKTHKKEKKDKDSIKIKKKKDKKDKIKDKSEKKREKEEKHEMKEKIKKEKKEKKKEKTGDGLVPKLTLKLGSSNSNSPMPPSSPDVFKLNIKPVIKKEEEPNSPIKEEPTSREHSPSPELAQISALVTRPPKQKHSKHNHVTETESSLPPSVSSPPRKNRPPSSHKYKRILFKPLSKKGHFEEETASVSDETAVVIPSDPAEKISGTLPTPYYVDEHGNKVWVCPACGRPDNGSPMIGCDGCDGWYHWVCVGITEEPGATEDWFCKSCLAKRAAMVLAGTPSAKKRGRKPKAEKVRDCN